MFIWSMYFRHQPVHADLWNNHVVNSIYKIRNTRNPSVNFSGQPDNMKNGDRFATRKDNICLGLTAQPLFCLDINEIRYPIEKDKYVHAVKGDCYLIGTGAVYDMIKHILRFALLSFEEHQWACFPCDYTNGTFYMYTLKRAFSFHFFEIINDLNFTAVLLKQWLIKFLHSNCCNKHLQ